MSRDGTGTYTPPAVMATANAIASSVTVNSIIDDISQALTDSINKDGTKAYAASQSMGGNRVTSLGAGTALTDAAQVTQVQRSALNRATTVGGTVDAITLAFTPAITAYTTGMMIRWVSGGANTITAPTVNVDTLGAKVVKQNPAGAAIAVGQLGAAGTIHMAEYNGTDFILLGAVPQALGSGDSPQFAAINIGAASDTTLARVSAGTLSVEGKTIATLSTAQFWSAAQAFGTVTGDSFRIDTKSSVTLGLGFSVGAGGTVTQTSSKSTSVTLNAQCGEITMDASALSAGGRVSFILNNSLIHATDMVLVHAKFGSSDAYIVQVYNISTGQATIVVKNDSASSLSQSLVIKFAILKTQIS